MAYLFIVVLCLIIILLAACIIYENTQVKILRRSLQLQENNQVNWQNAAAPLLPQNKLLCRDLMTYFRNLAMLREKLRQKNAEQKNLIASISHDFQTPLAAILGSLEIIEQLPANDESFKRSIHFLNIIKQQSQTLSEEIKSFYALALLESGDFKPNITQVNLYDILSNEIASRVNELEAKFHDNVTVELDETVPPLQQSELTCHRIISNLLKNSLDHGEREIKIKLEVVNDKQLLHIANIWHNPGIKDLNIIFSRSFRVDSARQQLQQSPHAGLGMSIVKDLCERFNIAWKIYETAVNNENSPACTPEAAANKEAYLNIDLLFSNYRGEEND